MQEDDRDSLAVIEEDRQPQAANLKRRRKEWRSCCANASCTDTEEECDLLRGPRKTEDLQEEQTTRPEAVFDHERGSTAHF